MIPNRTRRRAQKCSFRKLVVESLENRHLLASIQVIAAGVTNQETLVLQIRDQPVQTWSNLGGNAYGDQFVTLNFSTPGVVTPSQIKLAFTNDVYDPANGIDRNIRIDAIILDGTRYETESASVYSTGTWLPSDGIVAGYRRSEFLHANGYFQFADPVPTGSLLEVRAMGQVGAERFEIRVDNVTVANYTASTTWQTYSYRSPVTLTPDRIRIAFTNDLFDPARSIDHNLRVDYIVIDSTIYQTEAPNVFSTGTWLSSDGIQPGFRQRDTLHANGYFQYGMTLNPGNLSIRESVLARPENGSSVSVEVIRTGGSDGTVSVDYRTVGITASPGLDFASQSGTLTFLPGETSKIVSVPLLEDVLIEGDEQFGFTIDNPQGGATVVAPRTATIRIEDNDSIRSQGTGLMGEYFDGLDFTSRFLNRVDSSINFDLGNAAPITGMGADTFSVRWTGRIEPRFTETYTFTVRADDGVRLWINNQLLIDRWQVQSATAYQASVPMQAGVFADIRMEYFENQGSAVAQLSWQSPRQPLEIIPRSQLYPADPPIVTPGNALQTQNLYTGLVQPIAIDFAPDGRLTWIAEQRGTIRVVDNGNLLPGFFLDFRDRINGTRDRGLLDIAVHPNFPAQPFLYLIYTYDPPEVNTQAAGSLAGPDGNGNRAGRVTRVTADAATNFTTVVPNSELILVGKNSVWNQFNAFVNSTFNFTEPPAGIRADGTSVPDFIATDSESHTVGALEFGADGMLYVSIGDGASYNQVDPRASRVQDLSNLSGKILRVDPNTGRGLTSNPFYDGNPDSNRSKVWQSGFRNPFRMAFEPSSNRLFIGDVGWTQWEEINSGGAGANFGWPWFEGGNGTSLRTGGYQNLAAGQAFYASGRAVVAPTYAVNHSTGMNAIVLGDFYTGSNFPSQYRGNLFFNDLGQGIVRNMRFNANGSIQAIETFATGHRYVVQMKQGRDGNVYFVDIDDGLVGRWTFVNSSNGVAAASVTTTQPPLPPTPIGNGGSGVTVAVLDSGIDRNHPWLATAIWTNTREIAGDGIDNDRNGWVDDRHGIDLVDDDVLPQDEHGHGTFVAGLMAGREGNVLRGIAPGAKILPLRVLNHEGIGNSEDIAVAIRYAVQQGAKVIVLPLVTDDSTAVVEAISFARERGVLLVAASGNDSAGRPSKVASLSRQWDNVLSVGAVSADGARLPESNQVGKSGAVQIDANGIAWGLAKQGFATWRGTSVAAAEVGAIAALALASNSKLQPHQLRDLLIATGSIPMSGSDSASIVQRDAAVQMAQRMLAIKQSYSNGRWAFELTAGDDVVEVSADSREVEINGIRYRVPSPGNLSSLTIHGLGGIDRLRVVGSGENDVGIMRPELVRLTTPRQVLSGIGFETMNLVGGGGVDSLTLTDSVADDTITANASLVQLESKNLIMTSEGFASVQVNAATGWNTLMVSATDFDETLTISPTSTRIDLPSTRLQVQGAQRLQVDLGGGADRVVYQGSNSADIVRLAPIESRFANGDYLGTVVGAESIQAWAGGGIDSIEMLDSVGLDDVQSSFGDTSMVGTQYSWRAYQFETTTLRASQGGDRVTLLGTNQQERLIARRNEAEFTGAGFRTIVSGFSRLQVLGAGGDDQAQLIGSTANEVFRFAPNLASMTSGSSVVSIQQFRLQEFIGGGGSDRVLLTDGSQSDLLVLQRQTARLTSRDYDAVWSDIDRLTATSLIDSQLDRIRRDATSLDYVFEKIGDWIE